MLSASVSTFTMISFRPFASSSQLSVLFTRFFHRTGLFSWLSTEWWAKPWLAQSVNFDHFRLASKHELPEAVRFGHGRETKSRDSLAQYISVQHHSTSSSVT